MTMISLSGIAIPSGLTFNSNQLRSRSPAIAPAECGLISVFFICCCFYYKIAGKFKVIFS
ncbi:MAG: hypothetical protein ACFB02_07430 [Mastigocoleus sp.]